MKTFKTILCLFISLSMVAAFAQQGVTVNNQGAAAKSGKGGGAEIKKKEVSAKGSSGGGAVVNNKGSEIKNSKGGGVEAHKGEVAAKSSTGKGVEANKKGVQVKGSKGGMTIDKKKLEIKSKKVNVHVGK